MKACTIHKVIIVTFLNILLALHLSFSQQIYNNKKESIKKIPSGLYIETNQKEYKVMHYWESSLYGLSHKTFPEIEKIFVDYIFLLYQVPEKTAEIALKKTTNLFLTDSTMLNNIVNLSEKYFYSPNSPVRNEEFYIAVLETMLTAKHLTPIQKTRPAYQLSLMNKNRINTRAINFRYTLSNSEIFDLYSIESEFTILLFNNPECPACKEVTFDIIHSKVISSLSNKSINEKPFLKILNIYTDQDIKKWLEYTPSFPKIWINAYDENQTINNNELYDLKATPSLYLLDKTKKVLLKDASLNSIENYLYKTASVRLNLK